MSISDGLNSMGILTLSPRRMRRRFMIMWNITPRRLQVHIMMKVLPRHTTETLRPGILGFRLHLGKSLSLGGGMPTSFALLYIISRRSFVYPYFAFFCCFSLVYFISAVSLLISLGGCYYCSNLYFYSLFRLFAEGCL